VAANPFLPIHSVCEKKRKVNHEKLTDGRRPKEAEHMIAEYHALKNIMERSMNILTSMHMAFNAD
jgi:hypothetical protein